MNRREFSISTMAVSALATACAPSQGQSHTAQHAGQTQFPTKPRADATQALVSAIADAIQNNKSEIILPAGELHFWPDHGVKEVLSISNNDDVENAIAGPIDGAKNLTLRGQNTSLIFHGQITPFLIRNSSNITLANLSIDWEVPFHVEANVTSIDPQGKWIELDVPEPYQYEIRDGEFVFKGEGFEQVTTKRVMHFNRERRETEYMHHTANIGTGGPDAVRARFKLEALSPRRFRVSSKQGKLPRPPKLGNVLTLMPPIRMCPAVFLEDSKNVTFKNVTIHHSGCMGIIAQTCENITLQNSHVIPSGNRYISTCVDATHFVNCSGTVTVENGNFSNHIDDALNIHGTYGKIIERIDSKTIKCQFAHFQQYGVRNFRDGDKVSIADGTNVNVYLETVISKVEYVSGQYFTIKFEHDLPSNLALGDVVNNLSRQANLIYRGNSVSKNRARGILISTFGTVLVEDNYFHSQGAAIRISGGVDHWYESGPVSQVMIRNNEFDHCSYNKKGEPLITVICVDAEDKTSTKPYHDTVAITGNTFRTEHGDFVDAYRVGNLIFENNTIIVEPYQDANAHTQTPFELEAIGNHSIKNNTITGYSWPVFET
ncbi:hypothetical protein [Hirschia litorea]|uniref:Right handed beta helix region n=1 Tax=Hirschia litorea TaxID=1199156 RepID=A0ABW2IQ85_9PROT